jgi:hypothetical protein
MPRHSGTDIELQRRVRIAHDQKADRIHQRADADDAHGAELVGDRAGERLPDAPQQVLHRKSEREHVAAPAEFETHRLHEEADAGARPEGQHADQRPADHDHQRGAPAQTPSRIRNAVSRRHGNSFDAEKRTSANGRPGPAES